MMMRQDSWADQQGIIPGSELIELDGTEACLDEEISPRSGNLREQLGSYEGTKVLDSPDL